jgi:uncharacterized protein (DUF2147 family)
MTKSDFEEEIATMSKRLLTVAAGLVLALSLAGLAAAQDTKTTTTTTTQTTKTIQNPDGTYTVIQYPADKEVTVSLAPGTIVPTAHGFAKIMRHGEMTTVNLDLSDITGDVNNYNVYAVDPAGKFTLLGPVTISNGVATQTFTTPMDKFMLVLSPEANLTTIANNTPILFRSTVPEGFAVIPVAQSGPQGGAPVGERVAATTAPTNSPYTVPMLGIPNFRRGTDTHMKVHFPELNDARANVFLEPRKDGPTEVKIRFHSLTRVPDNKRIVVWAVAPDGKYTKLGQVINTRDRNEAEIKGETALQDFGLLVTLEDTDDIVTPAGPVFATVIREP